MCRRRAALFSVFFALTLGTALHAQAPQFRANVTQTGDDPFTGTMYLGDSRMRIEGIYNGEQAVIIVDVSANTMTMLRPAERMYVTMDLGSAPFSAPGATRMDPANPCSGGEVSDCRSLGAETVNGYAARGWEYTRDGERETAWIANELRFPVRTVEADGTVTDFTEVEVGRQPASLFEPPADYTAMSMPGFGGSGAGGRGQAAGGVGRGVRASDGVASGVVPPGATVPPGVDPAASAQLAQQLAAMGVPPDQIAAALAQVAAVGTATDSAPWEQGDGWVVELVVTASSTESGEIPLTGGSVTATYSVQLTASVPFPYGTPAVGAAVGPAWQLVPTLGSPRGLAEPITLSGTTRYHVDTNSQAQCPVADAVHSVTDGTGSVDFRTSDHGSPEVVQAQARWELAGDLRTHSLSVTIGATGTERSETTSTTQGACGDPPSTSTEPATREVGYGVGLGLTGLPLAPSPTTLRGTTTVPMRFDFGGRSVELPTQVQWTLRPIQ